MDVDMSEAPALVHFTFLHLNSDCTLVNITINEKGQVVVQ